ncbi:type II toxin-antitoxin system HicA family toxin [Achromobacter piechaudii]|uniref:type II toxin-antitoxin system HicA family toxin n=2 Tax=Achromobacter piechaudii TaxID=72556 RepID=UPI0009E45591
MSQSTKAVNRMCSTPPPADFEWRELVAVMKSFNFKLHTNDGSRRHFIGVVDGVERRFDCHEPHPSGIVKRYVIRQLKDFLKDLGLI